MSLFDILIARSLSQNIVSDEQITDAVNDWLDENPVMSGATKEEAEQIAKNKSAIEDLAKDAVKSIDGIKANEDGDIVVGAVRHTEQDLTDEQKARARANIGAGTSDFSGTWGDLSDKPLFIAEYGVTTYDDIVEAHDSGKAVYCKKNAHTMPLCSLSSDAKTISFIGAYTNARIRHYKVTSDNVWTDTVWAPELANRKTDVINSDSTTTQYPSAKAAYDYHTWDNLLNKPFGEVGVMLVLYQGDGFTTSDVLTKYNEDTGSHEAYNPTNETLQFTFEDGSTCIVECKYNSFMERCYYTVPDGEFSVKINTDGSVYGDIQTPNGVKIVKIESTDTLVPTNKTLDSKFIGEDIARVKDIPDSIVRMEDILEQVQPDEQVLEETTVEISDDGDYKTISESLYFEIGKTYLVIFDGVEYECVAWDSDGKHMIGNGQIYGGDGGNGEPFSCDSYDDGSCYVNVEKAGTHTISILAMGNIYKLSMKYLPDGYPYEGDLVETVLLEGSVDVGENRNAKFDYGVILEDGKTYIVTFNGVRYKCVANGYNIGSFDNGDPFEYRFDAFNRSYSLYTKEQGSYTVVISGITPEIHKIDPKYLPDGASIGMHGTSGGEIFNNYINNVASGRNAHAEGSVTEASGECAHTEGSWTKASGEDAHAEGSSTRAIGRSSHCEGYNTEASGENSHCEGYSTIAASINQHVQGKYNIEDGENKYAHIVGNGTAWDNHSNAHTLDWDGNAWFQGTIKVGGTGQDDEAAQEVALKSDVTTMIQEALSEFTNVAEVGA